MTDITVFGELLIDFSYAGLSPAGNRLFEQNPGGAPANVACCAAKFGKKTAFMGKVGDDMHGRFLKETLEKNQVDISGLLLDPGVFTTLAFVDLSPAGERSFSFARKPGADICFKTSDMNLGLLNSTKIFHVGSLSLTDEPARTATYEAVRLAKKAGAIISYDPNYRASLWKNPETAAQFMQSLIPSTDVMKFADEEAELLTGTADVDEALHIVQRKGVKIAAATLGKNGAKFIFNGEIHHVPGYQVEVIDTTGAGDSFWGGFLTCLVSSKKTLSHLTAEDVANFVHFGNAVAACCIGKRGAIPAMPDYDTIVQFLASHQ